MIRPRVICETCGVNEHAGDDECSCPWWGHTTSKTTYWSKG